MKMKMTNKKTSVAEVHHSASQGSGKPMKREDEDDIQGPPSRRDVRAEHQRADGKEDAKRKESATASARAKQEQQ